MESGMAMYKWLTAVCASIPSGRNAIPNLCNTSSFSDKHDKNEYHLFCETPACGLVIDRDLNAALNLAVRASQAHQSGPYREFLGKGVTPVERGALADSSQDGSVKLSLAKQEPDTDMACP
jgi:hypothetical protein